MAANLNYIKKRLYENFSGDAYRNNEDYQEHMARRNAKLEAQGTNMLNESFYDLFTEKANRGTLITKYVLLFGFIIALTILLSSLAYEKRTFDTDLYLYVTIFMVPIIVLIGMLVLSTKEKNKMIIFGYYFGALLLIVGMVYFYQKLRNMSSTYVDWISYLSQILLISMVLVGLAMFYNLFSDKLRRIPGTLGIAVNLIFFIPCLISDFLTYLQNQFTTTPSATYMLLIIEVILVLLYVYIPYLLKEALFESKIILDKPRFLDAPFNMVSGKELPKNTEAIRTITKNPVISNYLNYSWSMWIYLNDQQTMDTDKTIFKYGNDKLRIEYVYYSDDNVDTGIEKTHQRKMVKFTFMDNMVFYYDLPKQRWNNIVVNYNDNNVDLFINGKLVVSKEYFDSLPPYSDNDIVRAGDTDLAGAICNISYSKKVLSEVDIVTYYNLLINKNPPLNNIL